jgi:hypothetical protein
MFGAAAVVALTVLGTTCSIIGQGIQYRQMRAIERLSTMQRCVP